jgi:hypothetical protein
LPSSSDFKQPITRQDHTVCDNGNTPRSLGQNGYQQLPSGWIIQWGFAASWGSGDGTITFPIAFPVACRAMQATHLGPDIQFWSAEPHHHELRDPLLIQRQQRLLVARHRPLKEETSMKWAMLDPAGRPSGFYHPDLHPELFEQVGEELRPHAPSRQLCR